jgi:hypothetical protein
VRELGRKRAPEINQEMTSWFLIADRLPSTASAEHRFTPGRGRSPVASAATIISAATKQQQHDEDDQKQFHGTSPLMLAGAAARGVQYI